MDTNVKYIMNEEKEIFIKYIINLSRALDNSFSHQVLNSINKSNTFLSVVDRETKLQIKDGLIKVLYDEACKREKTTNITTIPFNQTMVMFVTAFETLLYDIFRYSVNNNERLKEKIIESKEKISIDLLEDYKNNKITFADVVISIKKYNFQNLDSANSAFVWALGSGIYPLLEGMKKNRRNAIVYLKEIIETRHKIIHTAYNDNGLNWKNVSEIHAFFFLIGLVIHGKLVLK